MFLNLTLTAVLKPAKAGLVSCSFSYNSHLVLLSHITQFFSSCCFSSNWTQLIFTFSLFHHNAHPHPINKIAPALITNFQKNKNKLKENSFERDFRLFLRTVKLIVTTNNCFSNVSLCQLINNKLPINHMKTILIF